MDSHEKYIGLCAASTAGELSRGEEQELEEHLAVCASCRRVKQEYEMTVEKAVSALADDLASPAFEADGDWSVQRAEGAFFKRLRTAQRPRLVLPTKSPKPTPIKQGSVFFIAAHSVVGTLDAVCGVRILAIALGFVAYRSGLNRGTASTQQKAATSSASARSIEEQISDFGHERSQFLTKLADDDKAINDFKQQIAEQTDEIKRLKAANANVGASKQSGSQSSADASGEIARRDAELVTAQTNLRQLEARVDALSQQREDTAKQAQALQVKVDELTQLARDRERALDEQQVVIAKQQVLLDHDRDIRELMGARDLYIAEVHDVAGTGETDKTYGRVFYTKGKSLIFYAYDLDQETNLKTASTFQAWGSRGIDKQQALSLGVFYEDSTSKKRWVLKFDDPKTLANIDAVFVTVEPHGGSHHPSGKQLLFAYLRVNPNHP